jgi:hypothetical protein
MKLEIKVSYGRTVNIGNYESVRIDTSIIEEIGEDDKRSYEEIFADLFDECEHFVLEKCETEIEETKENKKSSSVFKNQDADNDISF